MNASDLETRKQLVILMLRIDEQIDEIGVEARRQGNKPTDMWISDKAWPLTELYLAKAQALNAYVTLTRKE